MPIDLDLPAFWAENRASQDKPFRTDKPRAPIGLPIDDHWLIDEMKVPSTIRYYREPDYRAEINRRCNDRCEEAIGIRPFRQTPEPPRPLRIEEVFASHFELTEGGTPWLEPGVSTLEALRDLLTRIEKMPDSEFRQYVLNGATVEAQPLVEGQKKTIAAGSRGPATVATSVLGTQTYLYWLIDAPADMERFYEVLAQTLIRYHRVIEREANVSYRGYGWLDDNCCLLSPELYEHFCLPLMKRVFAEFAPAPGDWRYQHSDSAMAHLLPLLAPLDFKGVNLGPTIPAQEIRRQMPKAQIHGQVAPMTLRNGTADHIAAEVNRDFAAVGADGGLVLTTAGSISAGTTFELIRAFMWAVQEHARYDRA